MQARLENLTVQAIMTSACNLLSSDLQPLSCEHISLSTFHKLNVTACTPLGVEAFSTNSILHGLGTSYPGITVYAAQEQHLL